MKQGRTDKARGCQKYLHPWAPISLLPRMRVLPALFIYLFIYFPLIFKVKVPFTESLSLASLPSGPRRSYGMRGLRERCFATEWFPRALLPLDSDILQPGQ